MGLSRPARTSVAGVEEVTMGAYDAKLEGTGQ
jgi:hypothetical protein